MNELLGCDLQQVRSLAKSLRLLHTVTFFAHAVLTACIAFFGELLFIPQIPTQVTLPLGHPRVYKSQEGSGDWKFTHLPPLPQAQPAYLRQPTQASCNQDGPAPGEAGKARPMPG